MWNYLILCDNIHKLSLERGLKIYQEDSPNLKFQKPLNQSWHRLHFSLEPALLHKKIIIMIKPWLITNRKLLNKTAISINKKSKK